MAVVRSLGLPISRFEHLGHKYPLEMAAAVGLGAGVSYGTGKLYNSLMASRAKRRINRKLKKQIVRETLAKSPAAKELEV